MKKTLLIIILLFAVTSFSFSQKLPESKDILKEMTRVNDYVMKKKYADPTAVMPYPSRKKNYASNIWTRGVYYEGLMALYSVCPKDEYYDYAVKWADFHGWGMRDGNTATRNSDNYCCAQTYIDLYRLCPEPHRLQKTLACTDMIMNIPFHGDWTWIDAIQMGMPVFTKLGKLTGDSRYYEKAWLMYSSTRDEQGLYNEDEGLWWRDKDFLPPYTEPNGEDCYWSRGNGWVVAALAKVLGDITSDEPHRKIYLKDFRNMCQALLECQREDGFWNVSLHDPTNYGGKELTGTALFVYAMAWGVNEGILDEDVYYPVIVRSWNAMVKDCVHKNGFLGYVQGTGKEPKDGQPVTYDSIPDFEDYGAGCFLLAGSEVYRLSFRD